jgi:hypothetical protein
LEAASLPGDLGEELLAVGGVGAWVGVRGKEKPSSESRLKKKLFGGLGITQVEQYFRLFEPQFLGVMAVVIDLCAGHFERLSPTAKSPQMPREGNRDLTEEDRPPIKTSKGRFEERGAPRPPVVSSPRSL